MFRKSTSALFLTSVAYFLVEETGVSQRNHRHDLKAAKCCIKYNFRFHPLSLEFEPTIITLNAKWLIHIKSIQDKNDRFLWWVELLLFTNNFKAVWGTVNKVQYWSSWVVKNYNRCKCSGLCNPLNTICHQTLFAWWLLKPMCSLCCACCYKYSFVLLYHKNA